MEKLRAVPAYQTAMIYVYIEANLSFVTANRIKAIVNKPCFYPIQVQSFDPSTEERAGVWTGEVEKQLYTIELQRALADGALYYASNFVTQGDVKEVKSEVKEQLENFRREVTLVNGKMKVVYTGKTGTRKDDLCLVVQMLLHWSRENRLSDEYAQAATANGWRL